MHLITMAHLGEAQGVIDLFRPKKVSEHLYQGDHLHLLITGEGPFEAATLTAGALGTQKYSEVINLGIAGALHSELKIGTIHPVRMLYLVIEQRPQFKSFKSLDQGLDCLTSFERILDPKKAEILRGQGDLVDREAWGVAMAAKTHNIPMRSFKLVSDMAGTPAACEIVKENKETWSYEIAQYLMTILKTKQEISSKLKIEGLYFTFTTEHQFKNLLHKLTIKEEKSEEEILSSLPLADVRAMNTSPKEKTKDLLKIMEERIDPVKAIIKRKLKTWTTPFEKEGINLQVDPYWEDPKIKIDFEITSQEELQKKTGLLNRLNLSIYHDLLEGKIHVE